MRQGGTRINARALVPLEQEWSLHMSVRVALVDTLPGNQITRVVRDKVAPFKAFGGKQSQSETVTRATRDVLRGLNIETAQQLQVQATVRPSVSSVHQALLLGAMLADGIAALGLFDAVHADVRLQSGLFWNKLRKSKRVMMLFTIRHRNNVLFRLVGTNVQKNVIKYNANNLLQQSSTDYITNGK